MANNAVYAIKEMKSSILKLQEKKAEINVQTSQLEESIKTLYIINNICSACDGNGFKYDHTLTQGDPYARSSDAKVKCNICNGTGEFTKE